MEGDGLSALPSYGRRVPTEVAQGQRRCDYRDGSCVAIGERYDELRQPGGCTRHQQERLYGQ